MVSGPKISSFVDKLRSVLRGRDYWQCNIYYSERGFDLRKGLDSLPFVTLKSSAGILSGAFKNVFADPFLVECGDRVYVLFEVKQEHGLGQIWAAEVHNAKDPTILGPVLIEPFHLSYPYVFFNSGFYYMVPETAQAGEVRLYRSHGFPLHWRFERTIIDSPLRDVNFVFRDDGVYLLGSTANWDLQVYHSPSIHEKFHWIDTPIVNDASRARNAGDFIKIDGRLYRPSQNCKVRYGYAVTLNIVEQLNQNGYLEQATGIELFSKRPNEFLRGHHHVSYLRVSNREYIAVDGYRSGGPLSSLAYLINAMVVKRDAREVG